MKLSIFFFAFIMMAGQGVTLMLCVTNPFIVHPFYGLGFFVVGFWGTAMFFNALGAQDTKLKFKEKVK